MKETIPDALAGERIDRVVAMVAGCSRSDAAGLVSAGAVSLDGTVVRARTTRVAPGQELDVELPAPDEAAAVGPDAGVRFDVVYEDAHVIVVDKPPGLVVHPGAGNPARTLVNGLVARWPEIAGVGDPARPGIVHRLDKDTSGLLVVARSPLAYTRLVADLSAHQVHRAYLALVWGHFDAPTGMVDAPIGRSVRQPTRMAVSTHGREARTRYEVERVFDEPVEVCLARCELETGRTHQIRVHLAAIGHPVVGDARYGGTRQSLPVPRIWLHAARLGFAHPETGEELAFESPLPADLAAVLDGLQ